MRESIDVDSMKRLKIVLHITIIDFSAKTPYNIKRKYQGRFHL